MSKEISLTEVKQHKNSKSAWVVIHNDVYDLTKFLGEHPGGEDTILEVAGKECTQAFEDVGHSDDARELMKKYKIGTLPGIEKTSFVHTCKSLAECDNCDNAESQSTVPKSKSKENLTPRAERRVQSIIVPRERYKGRKQAYRLPDGERLPQPLLGAVLQTLYEFPSSVMLKLELVMACGTSKLKWALLALLGAVVIGVILKKKMSS